MPEEHTLWNPTIIIRQEGALKTSTRVIKVVTDRGPGFLKALGNPEGPHALACELIGTQLARWFKLPTFQYATIEVKEEYGLTFQEGGKVSPGPAFITKDDPGGPWSGSDRQLEELSNPHAITRLVIFDTWILNRDRYAPDGNRINRDNVFLSEEAPPGLFLLRAIDHSHCFTCGRPLSPKIGNIDQIRDEQIYGLFPEFRKRLDALVARDCTERLRMFRQNDADGMMRTLPREWDVEQSARTALANFLVTRAAFLADFIIDKLCPTGGR
jgi:hypothetical protein